jgi:hypothetical protein
VLRNLWVVKRLARTTELTQHNSSRINMLVVQIPEEITATEEIHIQQRVGHTRPSKILFARTSTPTPGTRITSKILV